jgi:homocitrate synthase NifV
MTGCSIPAHKAVIGAGLFDVESGVHVDGIAKNRQCYEPFPPEAVGAERRIVIGKHTGKHALALKLKELDISDVCDLERLLGLVREESIRTGSAVDDKTLLKLVRRVQEDDAA